MFPLLKTTTYSQTTRLAKQMKARVPLIYLPFNASATRFGV